MLISGTFQEKLLDKIDKCVARVTIGRQVPHPCFFSTKIGLAENLGRWRTKRVPPSQYGRIIKTLWALAGPSCSSGRALRVTDKRTEKSAFCLRKQLGIRKTEVQ